MTDYTITVGPVARDYTTPQAAWNSLPDPVDAADNYYIVIDAGTYGRVNYLDSNITVNGRVYFQAAAGDAWYENIDLTTDALDFLGTRGVVLTGTAFNEDFVKIKGNVTLVGLQIEGTANKGAVRFSSDGWVADKCIFYGGGSCDGPVTTYGATSGTIQNCLLISDTTDSGNIGVSILDTNGKTVTLSNNLMLFVGGGGGKWFGGSYGTGTTVKNCAVFGFAAGDDSRINSASSNNCTDLASFPGASNLLSQTVTDHIESLAAPDARVKATSSMLGGGVDTGLTEDITGQARSLPLSIGVQEDFPSASDTTPDAYSFTDQTDVTISTMTTSNTITVTGIDASTPISITGGEYSINSGGFTSSPGSVVVNDTVQLRVTSSASNSTAVDVDLDIGGVLDTWTVTTIAASAGTLTTEPLKNNTGSVIASDTGLTVDVYSISTGALVVRFTGETTDASGICAVSDALINATTAYTVVVRRSTNAIGVAEITAT